VSPFDIVRQGLIHQFAAVPAAINRLNIFRNVRFNGWQIDYLMPQGVIGGFFQMNTTTQTTVRNQFDLLSDFFRWQQRSQMRLVAFSSPAFLSPELPWQNSCHARRIGGRRFGGILRIHAQSLLQIFDMFLHLFEPKDMPIQGKFKPGICAWVELQKEYIAGLKDLNDFSHAIIIYCFRKSEKIELEGNPFLEDHSHGMHWFGVNWTNPLYV